MYANCDNVRNAATRCRPIATTAERASPSDSPTSGVIAQTTGLIDPSHALSANITEDQLHCDHGASTESIGQGTVRTVEAVDIRSHGITHPSEGSDDQSRSQNEAEKVEMKSSGSMPVPPPNFCCPISMEIMSDPVMVATGHTYDRSCIEKWLTSGHGTCPLSGQRLRHTELTPNIALRNIIQV
jgi:hypothetical protein